MNVAVKILDRALRQDFGFKDILWVYSGRRGIHCWVCDERARNLTDHERSAVAKYLTVVEGNAKSARRMKLTIPLHPSLRNALAVLEPVFVENIIQEHGQGLLCDPEHWGKILDMLPNVAGLREDVERGWKDYNRCKNANDRWDYLKKMCQNYVKKVNAGKLSIKNSLMLCPQEIIFTCTYPRLDINVSTHRNHLLKSPFVVHPKTGRVCVRSVYGVGDREYDSLNVFLVIYLQENHSNTNARTQVPIDPNNCDSFDPFAVPSLSKMSDEINKYDASQQDSDKKVSDLEKTSLHKHVKFFEKSFLAPMYSRIRKRFREMAEKEAAATGDW